MGLFLATPPGRAVERGASSECFLGRLTGVSKEEKEEFGRFF